RDRGRSLHARTRSPDRAARPSPLVPLAPSSRPPADWLAGARSAPRPFARCRRRRTRCLRDMCILHRSRIASFLPRFCRGRSRSGGGGGAAAWRIEEGRERGGARRAHVEAGLVERRIELGVEAAEALAHLRRPLVVDAQI